MVLKNFFQLISFALILYFIVESFLHIEFTATKNNHLTAFQKYEIDTTQNIDTVKLKAKGYLDTIRGVHRNNSANSLINFWLLIFLIIIQVFLFTNRPSLHVKRITPANIALPKMGLDQYFFIILSLIIFSSGWTIFIQHFM